MGSRIPPGTEAAIIEIGKGMALVFRAPPAEPEDFPTSCVQKGLALAFGERALVQEGLVFGVPLLRFGNEDVFTGDARFTAQKTAGATILEAGYSLNLVKRLERKGRKIQSRSIYRIEAYLGHLHRRYPLLRGMGNWFFGSLRDLFGINAVFETAASFGTFKVIFTSLMVRGLYLSAST